MNRIMHRITTLLAVAIMVIPFALGIFWGLLSTGFEAGTQQLENWFHTHAD